jgi:hypothetical protein
MMTTPAPTPTPTPIATFVVEPELELCISFEFEPALVVGVDVIDVPVLVVVVIAVDDLLEDSVIVFAVEVGSIPAVAVMVGSSRVNFKYEALVQQSSAEQQ